MTRSVRLRQLIRRNHWQTHRTFNNEYDRAAASVDLALVGTGPSRAQLHRWLTGEVKGLPYPDHCRVLEKMFPGWSAEQLFEPCDEHVDSTPVVVPRPQTEAPHRRTADISAAFPTRAAFLHTYPPHVLFDRAKSIKAVGLSLNLLCQSYPDSALLDLLETGAVLQCLFLDPAGKHIRDREREEGHPRDVLTTLTTLNIHTLQRVRSKVSPEFRDNLCIRTYDDPVRFNVVVIDDARCVFQPYLPEARGLQAPTLVIDRNAGTPGLFDTFAQVFESMWNRGKELS